MLHCTTFAIIATDCVLSSEMDVFLWKPEDALVRINLPVPGILTLVITSMKATPGAALYERNTVEMQQMGHRPVMSTVTRGVVDLLEGASPIFVTERRAKLFLYEGHGPVVLRGFEEYIPTFRQS
jgi:hypothetical protein